MNKILNFLEDHKKAIVMTTAFFFVGIVALKILAPGSDYKSVRARAEKGNAKAQYTLAEIYVVGDQVEHDVLEAIFWYNKSAEQGNKNAQLALGNLFEKGREVKRNTQAAYKWLAMAAEQGVLEAQKKIAHMAYNGIGCQQNFSESLRWRLMAAEQGDAESQRIVGNMHLRGIGTEKNREESLKWLHKSIAQGNANALYLLGYYYETDTIVRNSYDGALRFYKEASEKGNKKAAKRVEVIQNYLEILKKAERNDGESQFQIAVIHEKGVVGLRNRKSAISWYEKAVENHCERAIVELNRLKEHIAIEESAAQGDADAIIELADRYFIGVNCKRNPNKSIELYKKINAKSESKAGVSNIYGKALFELSEIYKNTLVENMTRDECLKESSRLLAEAAKNGNEDAKKILSNNQK